MKLSKFMLVAAAASTLATAAHAQAKIFVVDEMLARQESKIGKDLAAKLGSIRDEGVNKLGLKTLSDSIKTDEEALKPQVQALTPEAINANPTLKSKVDALNKKRAELMQKAGALEQDLNQQSGAATQAFGQALGPAVEYVAKEVGADIVLSSSSLWFAKSGVDITKKVVARLDATMPSLEALQAAMAPPQGAGAAPAAASAGPPAAAKPAATAPKKK